MYAKVGIPERELTLVNTIDYNFKSCQVIMTMVNFTDV